MDVPERIGKYEILSRLGKGGMAEVFLGRMPGAAGFGKKVALKRLAAHQLGDELLVKSLINEAIVASQLSHPNLVQVFEFEYIDGAYCMVMEYIDGMTLEALLNRCRSLGMLLPRGLVVYIAQEVCAGLHYAHAAQADDGSPLHLVHRDIKPSNVMISRRGQVKIMDFGIAKSNHNPYQTTVGGGVKGTLAYMSPEQLAGESLTPASDLFSLGVVLYEAATLERLQDDTNLLKLAQELILGLRPVARDKIQACFPELIPILDRLLDPEPSRRYADVRELMLALRPLLFGTGAMELAEFLEDVGSSPEDEGSAAGTVRTNEREKRLAVTRAEPVVASSADSLAPSGALLNRTANSSERLPTEAIAPLGGGAVVPQAAQVRPSRLPWLVALVALVLCVVLALVLLKETSSPQAVAVSPGTAPAVVASAPPTLVKPVSVPVAVPSPGPETGKPGERLEVATPVAAPSTPAVAEQASPPRTTPAPVGSARGSARGSAPSPVVKPVMAGTGKLVINAIPWAQVSIDGKAMKNTPMSTELPAGRHHVRLVTSEGKSHEFEVTVTPDHETVRVWSFMDGQFMN